MDLKPSGQYKLDMPPELLSAVFLATKHPYARPHINRDQPFPAAQGHIRYERRNQPGVLSGDEGPRARNQSRLDTPRTLP